MACIAQPMINRNQLIFNVLKNQNQDCRLETHFFSSLLVWLDIILMHLLDHLSAIKTPHLSVYMSKKNVWVFHFFSLHAFSCFINLWSNSLCRKLPIKKKRTPSLGKDSCNGTEPLHFDHNQGKSSCNMVAKSSRNWLRKLYSRKGSSNKVGILWQHLIPFPKTTTTKQKKTTTKIPTELKKQVRLKAMKTSKCLLHFFVLSMVTRQK